MNSTFSRFCIHRAESPIVAASGCPSTSFSPAPSAAVSRFRVSKILRLGLTVVVDHLSGRVVWAGKERKAKTLLRFFRKLGPRRAAELEAVSMDMWEPYITVVGKKAPQARVIFDRFHIVKHLNEAVDKTRRELVRELKGTARRNLKNTKFPLLKAKHNRSAKDKRVLREQVRANRRLYRAMLLRDDFMDLYTYKTETWAKKFLRGWLRRAMSSRIEPVKRAAKMIRSHFDGVIAWVTWRLSNGRLEGMNNKIRLLSHAALDSTLPKLSSVSSTQTVAVSPSRGSTEMAGEAKTLALATTLAFCQRVRRQSWTRELLFPERFRPSCRRTRPGAVMRQSPPLSHSTAW